MTEKMINRAQKMLLDRYLYFQKHARRSENDSEKSYYYMVSSMADAYQSACEILAAALSDNKEVLDQFDYYGEAR